MSILRSAVEVNKARIPHTRGGSVSLAKCRCLAMAAMNPSVAARVCRGGDHARIGLAVGQRRINPAGRE